MWHHLQIPHDQQTQANRAHQQALVKPKGWTTAGIPTTRMDKQWATHTFKMFSSRIRFADLGRCGYSSLCGFSGHIPAPHTCNHLGKWNKAKVQVEKSPPDNEQYPTAIGTMHFSPTLPRSLRWYLLCLWGGRDRGQRPEGKPADPSPEAKGAQWHWASEGKRWSLLPTQVPIHRSVLPCPGSQDCWKGYLDDLKDSRKWIKNMQV